MWQPLHHLYILSWGNIIPFDIWLVEDKYNVCIVLITSHNAHVGYTILMIQKCIFLIVNTEPHLISHTLFYTPPEKSLKGEYYIPYCVHSQCLARGTREIGKIIWIATWKWTKCTFVFTSVQLPTIRLSKEVAMYQYNTLFVLIPAVSAHTHSSQMSLHMGYTCWNF